LFDNESRLILDEYFNFEISDELFTRLILGPYIKTNKIYQNIYPYSFVNHNITSYERLCIFMQRQDFDQRILFDQPNLFINACIKNNIKMVKYFLSHEMFSQLFFNELFDDYKIILCNIFLPC